MCDFGISGYLVDSVAKTIDAGCKRKIMINVSHSFFSENTYFLKTYILFHTIFGYIQENIVFRKKSFTIIHAMSSND